MIRRLFSTMFVLSLVSCGDDDACKHPAAVIISIDSVPLMSPVTNDLVVYGHTEIPNDVTVSGVRLGARGPFSEPGEGTIEATSGSADRFATWTGTVPIGVLLTPNNGPGEVVVEAVPNTNCGDGKVKSSTSSPIEVSYPPDAAVDAPLDSAGSDSGSGSGSGAGSGSGSA